TALEGLREREKDAFAEVTLIGIGPGTLVALGCAIFEPSVSRVVLVEPLVSFRSDVPYVDQRMGIFAPRILRDVGDVPHLAALVAPRKLVLSGGVAGGGERLSAAALREPFAYAQKVYRLHGVEAHVTVSDAEQVDDLVRRLSI